MAKKRMTVAEVKRRNVASGGNFFSRDTMKFFGDTMRNFGIKGGGKVLYRKKEGTEYDILPSGKLKWRKN